MRGSTCNGVPARDAARDNSWRCPSTTSIPCPHSGFVRSRAGKIRKTRYTLTNRPELSDPARWIERVPHIECTPSWRVRHIVAKGPATSGKGDYALLPNYSPEAYHDKVFLGRNNN